MANTQVGGLSLEPLQGNSITQFLRSIEGLTGTTGQQSFNSGQSLLQGGGQTLASGGNTYAQGLQEMAPSLDYLTKLVKGDSADTDQALQPQVDQIKSSFDQARKLISTQGRGGGKSTLEAELPFDQAKTIANTKAQARTAAVGQLSQLSAQLAQLGLGQEGVGLSQEGVGLGESQLGASLLGESANIGLGVRGQDFTQQAQTQQFLSGLIDSVTGLISPIKIGGK